jgi:hypothetical protein
MQDSLIGSAPVSEQRVSNKKQWHAPQCTSKTWRTPRVVSIAFTQTSAVTTSNGPESSNLDPS